MVQFGRPIVDIVGALLLFKYGLPEPLDRRGHVYLIAEQTDEDEATLAQSYVALSKIGLALLGIGFVLQLASNFLPG
jgi:hypothetical protein